MKIKRIYNLEEHLVCNKVLVIYGARQVGKTTLLKNFLAKTELKYKFDTGENILTKNLLSSGDLNNIKKYAEGFELIAIDEAQNIPNIGMALKFMVDHIDNIKIIVTGSSSFELAGQIGDPLTLSLIHI